MSYEKPYIIEDDSDEEVKRSVRYEGWHRLDKRIDQGIDPTNLETLPEDDSSLGSL